MKIVQAQADVNVLGVNGSHNFLVLLGDNGQELGQLHGWQVKDGKVEVAGVGGNLQVRSDYTYNMNDLSIDRGVLWEGDAATGLVLWETAKDCGVAVNNINYSYNFLDSFGGHNSNAAAYTLVECMDLNWINLEGFSPGEGELILDSSVIEYIQSQNPRPPKDNGPYNPASLPQEDEVTIVGVHELVPC